MKRLIKKAALLMSAAMIITSLPAVPVLADTQTDEIRYNSRFVDFDQASGNTLIAVNPMFMYYDEDGETVNRAKKHLGTLLNYDASNDLPVSGYSEATGHIHTDTEPYICGTMLANADYSFKPSETNDQAPADYKVGDVMLRTLTTEILSEEYVSADTLVNRECTDKEYSPVLYQCMYIGKYSTIWGCVPEDKWTQEETEKILEVCKSPKGNALKGLIGHSDVADRTYTVSADRAEDIGKMFDYLINLEKEYTGDYLITDEKYGDKDKRSAFFVEPMSNDVLGYFDQRDFDEDVAGANGRIDCLHINYETDPVKKTDAFFTTMLHELQHYIVFGYVENNVDAAIDELMAQVVSMQVYGELSEDVESYTDALMDNVGMTDDYGDEGILHPYMLGECYNDKTMRGTPRNTVYRVAYPLGQYLIDNVDPKFVKTWTTGFSESGLYRPALSSYLKKTTGHSLEGWLSAFSIALGRAYNGFPAGGDVLKEYDLGNSKIAEYVRSHAKDARKDTDLAFGEYFWSPRRLTESKTITGGGSMHLYTVSGDQMFEIDNVEDGVVYALVDHNGKVVGVDGIELYDDCPCLQPVVAETNVKLSDGNVYPVKVSLVNLNTVRYSGKAKYNEQITDIEFDLSGLPDRFSEYYGGEQNPNLIESMIYLKKSASKNTKKAYFFKEGDAAKKRPRVSTITLGVNRGASKDTKKVVKALNKAIKKALKTTPMYFDIRPANLKAVRPQIVTKAGGKKIKSVTGYLGGKKYKFKKSDYEILRDDAGLIYGIMAKEGGNFTGYWFK